MHCEEIGNRVLAALGLLAVREHLVRENA